MTRFLLAVGALLLVPLMFVGCSDDEEPVMQPPAGGMATPTLQAEMVTTPPVSLSDPYWAAANWRAVTSTNQSIGLLYGDGQMNMSGTFDGTTEFSGGVDPGLTLKAAYDAGSIYILAEWTDVVFNLDRRRWLYNGPPDPRKAGESTDGWTSQLNDDKIGLAFEINAASSMFGTFDDVGCEASCHNVGGGPDMRPDAGMVDIWHWKTSRSEPYGYVNDQFSEPTNGRKTDAGTGIENRNRIGTTNRSGPEFEWDGTPQMISKSDGNMVSLDPAYLLVNKMNFMGDAVAGDVTYKASCGGCHGPDGEGGVATAFTSPSYTRWTREVLADSAASATHPGAAAWNGLATLDQTNVLARLRGMSGIPGYYLGTPSGSAADLRTVSNVSYTLVNDTMHARYQVIMIRDLDTGNADDAQFTPATVSSYKFGVALMDNDGRNHVGSRLETLDFMP